MLKIPWGIDRIGATESSAISGDCRGAVEGPVFFLIDSGMHLFDVNVCNRLEDYTGSTSEYVLNEWYGDGNHIAGTAVALDDGYGVVGVAPGVETYSLKVLDEDGETEISTTIRALDRVVEFELTNPERPVVVNISFGADVGTTEDTALDLAVNAAVSRGVVVVVAAGNEWLPASTFCHSAKWTWS